MQNATHLIIFTSTYGSGGPPANASDFEDAFEDVEPLNPLKFAVLAFGSTSFQDFCQFGVDVDGWLESKTHFERLLPIVKVNNQSDSDFRGWLSLWNRTSNMDIQIDLKSSNKKASKTQDFTIIENQEISGDETHLIKLRPKNDVKFQSGDLLSVHSEDGQQPYCTTGAPPKISFLYEGTLGILLMIRDPLGASRTFQFFE